MGQEKMRQGTYAQGFSDKSTSQKQDDDIKDNTSSNDEVETISETPPPKRLPGVPKRTTSDVYPRGFFDHP